MSVSKTPTKSGSLGRPRCFAPGGVVARRVRVGVVLKERNS